MMKYEPMMFGEDVGAVIPTHYAVYTLLDDEDVTFGYALAFGNRPIVRVCYKPAKPGECVDHFVVESFAGGEFAAKDDDSYQPMKYLAGVASALLCVPQKVILREMQDCVEYCKARAIPLAPPVSTVASGL